MAATAYTSLPCPECHALIKVAVTLELSIVEGGVKLYPLRVDDSLVHRHYAKAHAKAEQL